MNFEKVTEEVLRYLFREYLKAPNVVFAIDHIIRKHQLDPVVFSEKLLADQFIRERWVYEDDSVTCRISVHGIEHINPTFVQDKLKQLVGGLMRAGGSQSLLEILQHKIEEYAIALDFVRQLEALGLVTSEKVANSIVVTLSDEGKRFFDKSSRTIFTLMAVA